MMKKPDHSSDRVIVIGAGIGGLAAALPLVHRGFDVTLLEQHGAPGGKMRQVNGVDAGPTVLTMLDVFEAVFDEVGEALQDHVSLIPQPILARHWWPDSGPLDLFPNQTQSADAIEAFAGPTARTEFTNFAQRAARLFDGFRDPMMLRPEPRLSALTLHVLRNPRLIQDMGVGQTLGHLLKNSFTDPRLRQLFGRYATYVGGSPDRSPALLSLIWRAEEHGVWRVEGGMHRLAAALAEMAEGLGAEVRYATPAARIERQGGRAAAVVTGDGKRIAADEIVFAGDPRALALGLLGPGVAEAVPRRAVEPRSLSARVWSFASNPRGADLLHHNVFFGADNRSEFGPIAAGRPPVDPTLYICAEDRGANSTPPAIERFEIIENAAPVGGATEEAATCRTRVFRTLSQRGLSFDPEPGLDALTTPEGFETLFPGSAGSLYGLSPHGPTAALKRPRARTVVPGLFLAGGGAHPGAGVPMATLSGRHAAETITSDRISTSGSRRTVMPGGISTGSPTTAPARSRSSPS